MSSRQISIIFTLIAKRVAALVIVALLGSTGVAHGQTPPKRVLLVTYNLFYNHSNLAAIEETLPELGKAGGFTVTSLQGYKQTTSCTIQKPCPPSSIDLSMINRRYLSQFDAIVFSTTGELPFTEEGKQALVDFVKKDGKGIVFLHQSSVTLYTFKPWGEMLGAYIGVGEPLFDAMNKTKRPAVMKVEDRDNPATRNLPEHWTLDDEFYRFPTKVWDPANPDKDRGPTGLPVPLGFSRDRVHVLVSFDSERTDFTGVKGWEKGGDYPQVWCQTIGKGRTFYTAIGHRPDLWLSDPVYRGFITGAVRWALGVEEMTPRNGEERIGDITCAVSHAE